MPWPCSCTRAGSRLQRAPTSQQQMATAASSCRSPASTRCSMARLKAADKGECSEIKLLPKAPGGVCCVLWLGEGRRERNMFQPGSTPHHLHSQHSQPARMELKGFFHLPKVSCSSFPASCSNDLENEKERGKKSVYEKNHPRVLVPHVQQCYCHGTREQI